GVSRVNLSSPFACNSGPSRRRCSPGGGSARDTLAIALAFGRASEQIDKRGNYLPVGRSHFLCQSVAPSFHDQVVNLPPRGEFSRSDLPMAILESGQQCY